MFSFRWRIRHAYLAMYSETPFSAYSALSSKSSFHVCLESLQPVYVVYATVYAPTVEEVLQVSPPSGKHCNAASLVESTEHSRLHGETLDFSEDWEISISLPNPQLYPLLFSLINQSTFGQDIDRPYISFI